MSCAEAQRTLVKSPPELWGELSDPSSLARHLGELGELRITRVEGETNLEWEADAVSGTVRLEPSGWGTRVTLTIAREAPEQAPATAAPAAQAESETQPDPPMSPERRTRIFARLLRRWRRPVHEEEPEAQIEKSPDLAAELAAELERLEATMAEQDTALLSAVLDRLGAAHHRPFSRG
jgi:hypothetical protein